MGSELVWIIAYVIVGNELVGHVDHFTYLRSLLRASGFVSEKTWTRIKKVHLTFDKILYL